MDDLALLLADHSLLNSQVTRVVVMLRNLSPADSETDDVYTEIARQTMSLHDQIVEHFDLEKATVFPRLKQTYASWESQLRQFEAQHDGILHALEEFRSELALARVGKRSSDPLSAAIVFEREFDEHASLESAFFERHIRTSRW